MQFDIKYLSFLFIYVGLDRIIFIVCEWAEHHALFTGSFNPTKLSLLLIQFLVGHYVTDSYMANDCLIGQVTKFSCIVFALFA